MRNLEYPLDWDAVFDYVGEHGFMKPVDGGGWRDVHHIHNREEFFAAYDQSRDLCMMYQKAVDFTEYFRCYVVGQSEGPHHALRPAQARTTSATSRIRRRTTRSSSIAWSSDALKLCRALGYDLNTVEFAVENGIPYAIDFMNPAPDADLHSVGQANFDWIVREVADLAIAKAHDAPRKFDLHWSAFLGSSHANATPATEAKPAKKKTTAAPKKAKKEKAATNPAAD